MSATPKRKVTFYVAQDVLRATRVRAARSDRSDSEIVEDALRVYLGFEPLSGSGPEAISLRTKRSSSPSRSNKHCATRSVPRAVLDPNVLVSAIISGAGARAQLLVELRTGPFEPVLFPLLLTELSELLKREKFRRYVSAPEVDAYVDVLRRESLFLDDPDPSAEPTSVDPDDEYLIDLARAAGADALVSDDPHLVSLRHALPVLTPREFLETLDRL